MDVVYYNFSKAFEKVNPRNFFKLVYEVHVYDGSNFTFLRALK